MERILITVPEYKKFELSDLSKDEINFLNDLRKQKKLRKIDINENKCIIKTNEYVGVIFLKKYKIFIKPKVPLENLFRLIQISKNLPSILPEESMIEGGESIQDLLVNHFLKLTQEMVISGIQKDYQEIREASTYIRGKILFQDSKVQYPRKVNRLICLYDDYTSNTIDNQILKTTLWFIQKINPTNKQRLFILQLLDVFHEVSLLTELKDDIFHDLLYNRLNERYRLLHRLSHLILQNLSYHHSFGNIPFSSFLIDMNALFEDFILELLKLNLPDKFSLIHKQKTLVKIRTFYGMDTPKFTKIEPDISIYEDHKLLMVLDVKYKKGPFEENFGKSIISSNFHQIYTYSRIKNSPGVLIYPQKEEKIHLRLNLEKLPIDIVTIDLSKNKNEFNKECENLVSLVRHLITESTE